jgi:hypothetical protein
MALPTWISTDLTKAYFAAERTVSPRLETVLRTDAALDVIAASVAVRRLAGRAVRATANGIVEVAGLPSSRQVRQLQRSIDELQQGRR